MTTVEGFEDDEVPRHSPLVQVAGVILAVIGGLMTVAGAAHAYHLAIMPYLIDEARQTTGMPTYGLQVARIYAPDILAIIVALAFAGFTVWTARALFRGSTAARTRAIVVSILLSIGCLAYKSIAGTSTLVDQRYDPCRGYCPARAWLTLNEQSRTLVAKLVALQQAHVPAWCDQVLPIATAAISLLALILAILLMLPQSTEYFAAMRRAGRY